MLFMKFAALIILLLISLTGCINVKTQPIRVEPIKITMDINVRIAKELDNFFGDLDAQSSVLDYSASETK